MITPIILIHADFDELPPDDSILRRIAARTLVNIELLEFLGWTKDEDTDLWVNPHFEPMPDPVPDFTDSLDNLEHVLNAMTIEMYRRWTRWVHIFRIHFHIQTRMTPVSIQAFAAWCVVSGKRATRYVVTLLPLGKALIDNYAAPAYTWGSSAKSRPTFKTPSMNTPSDNLSFHQWMARNAPKLKRQYSSSHEFTFEPTHEQHYIISQSSDDWRDIGERIAVEMKTGLGNIVPLATNGILVLGIFKDQLFVAHATNLPEIKPSKSYSSRPKQPTKPRVKRQQLSIDADSLLDLL